MVNRTPRALSSAVSEYLDDPAYLRLSRNPPTPRQSLDPSEATPGAGYGNGNGGMRRSASVPQHSRMPTASPGGEEVFSSFLERQQAHLQRKRVAEAKRLEAQEAEIAAMYTVGKGGGTGGAEGSQSARPSLGGKESLGSGMTTPRPSFLDRVAEATRRRSEISRAADNDLPSEHVEHCSFRPVITQTAHARRARSVNELSTGDLQRRLSKQEQKRQAKELEGEEGLSFQPAINEVPGVQSRLKVATEPKSYLARVRQHMKLKEQLTACVREAQESQELAECTFHPTTHEAPAYISRIAKSVRIAKQAQPPPPPKPPEWR